MRRCSTRCWPATAAHRRPCRSAVGIYERDGGLLWKHYDVYSQQNQSRRARQLVVFFVATIGNYDYAINWIFHQDGVIEVDAALTGIMLPKGVKEIKAGDHNGVHRSGHLVAPTSPPLITSISSTSGSISMWTARTTPCAR